VTVLDEIVDALACAVDFYMLSASLESTAGDRQCLQLAMKRLYAVRITANPIFQQLTFEFFRKLMTDAFDTVRAKKGFNWPHFHVHWHYPDWIVLLGVAALSDTNQSEVSYNVSH